MLARGGGGGGAMGGRAERRRSRGWVYALYQTCEIVLASFAPTMVAVLAERLPASLASKPWKEEGEPSAAASPTSASPCSATITASNRPMWRPSLTGHPPMTLTAPHIWSTRPSRQRLHPPRF
ncbi:hypothetical protein OsI_12353 [Oryza sativa Indica Group]|uniref:Uncharacterized protein n=1 Tax=Oryza sativa subsp. indica TaxID=39946 RepID=B8AL53_ORYSI|nr:hypothetical protein OsI_12353 [Oryza sativa Indica Group]